MSLTHPRSVQETPFPYTSSDSKGEVDQREVEKLEFTTL